jgi:membrane peptidoglycan carboxypeptidase
MARRQPGSTIKPLLLLSAFESCGSHGALTAATRLADEPLTVRLPDGDWTPENNDRKFRGVVELREALDDSLNVPFVRLALFCGCQEIADRLRGAGLDLPELPPPSFALGAIETTPLELAKAYTVFATPGRVLRPRPVWRIERPTGRGLEDLTPGARRVVSPASAYLVTDMLRTVVSEGTAEGVNLAGLDVAAKTGTSSERRDAWLAGLADSVVCVVWVGRDDGKPIGLTGAHAAAPTWRAFMDRAARARPARTVPRPDDVVELSVDVRTGLLVQPSNPHARRELFRKGAEPRRDRWWRWDSDMPVVR